MLHDYKIKGFPGYTVCEDGTVWSRRRRISGTKLHSGGHRLQPFTTQRGYLTVNLYHQGKRKSFRVHKLVTETFLGPRPNGKEVNHKDGNKKNNRVGNLEYITHLENIRHAEKNNLTHHSKGEAHGRAKVSEDDVRTIRDMYVAGAVYQRELGEMYGLTRGGIACIVAHVNWKGIE